MCTQKDQTQAQNAIQAVTGSALSFCKFFSSNDTGESGSHQAGIYIAKQASRMLFDKPVQNDPVWERFVDILWPNGQTTHSRFVYYDSKKEYRITNFGRNFPFLGSDFTGALFILVKRSADKYQAFVLNTDDEINEFLQAVNLTPAQTNCLINSSAVSPRSLIMQEIQNYISTLDVFFPESSQISMMARRIQEHAAAHPEGRIKKPDSRLLDYIDVEYTLFRAVEKDRYAEVIKNGFDSIEDFINLANTILNRRKSRAGKSFEHHLSAIFDRCGLSYDAQAVTEGHKRPDFIFPSAAAYHDEAFPTDKLCTLAVKTTCKDRWRQVINEADRLKGRTKFLCTLQQGISPNQLQEMAAEQVQLVVPEPYIKTYTPQYRDSIWSVDKFIRYIQEQQRGLDPKYLNLHTK